MMKIVNKLRSISRDFLNVRSPRNLWWAWGLLLC
jgi:hypothetical protein